MKEDLIIIRQKDKRRMRMNTRKRGNGNSGDDHVLTKLGATFIASSTVFMHLLMMDTDSFLPVFHCISCSLDSFFAKRTKKEIMNRNEGENSGRKRECVGVLY
jgi:hypothetical protein